MVKTEGVHCPRCEAMVASLCVLVGACGGPSLTGAAVPAAPHTLHIGTSGRHAPFVFIDDQKQVVGVDMDLLRTFATNTGRSVHVSLITIDRVIEAVAAGRIDVAVGGLNIVDWRQRQAAFTEPYYCAGKQIMVRCAEAESFPTWESVDRPEITIMVNRGGHDAAVTRERVRFARVIEHPDAAEVYDYLLEGKVDAVISNFMDQEYQARLNPRLCRALDGRLLSHDCMGFAFKHGDGLRDELNAWLRKELQAGTIDRLIQKYLPPR